MSRKISRFDFLEKVEPILIQLGTLAETYPENDPHASLIRLRQFGDELGRLVAQKFCIYIEKDEVYFDLLENLKERGDIPRDILSGFNQLRTSGNNALHHFQGNHKDVRTNIRTAVKLGRWFFSIENKQSKFNSIEKALPTDIKSTLKKVRPKIPPEKNENRVSHDYSGKDLCRGNFSGKNLIEYDFSGANLYRANFNNANLKNTVFDGADVRGADFMGSKNLQASQLENVLMDEHTKLPAKLTGRFKNRER